MAERRKRKHSQWAKLDNTALLFPVISGEGMSSVYRESVTLTEEVDPALLQEAVEKVLPQFLTFRMRLRAGFFWYYFEENDRKVPKVTEETDFPGAYINRSRNNHYMFRVTYYKRRINLEVFHALTDGYGGLIFLKELIYQYLRLAHPEEFAGEKDRISSGIFMDQEDSYVKNFKKSVSHDAAYGSRKAVVVRGERLPKGELAVIHGYFSVEQLKEVSKRYGLTINQYLVGNYVYAIYREYLKGAPSKLPISCCVPVDLRSRYDSHTMKNFFVVISAKFAPEKEEYSREEVLAYVAQQLKEQQDPKNLDNILSYNVSNEQNVFLRPIPLFIKNIAIRRVYQLSADTATSTMTNVGNVEVKEPYRKYVEHFYAMLSMSRGQNIKGAICSYNGTLILTFTSCLTDMSIQKRFFQCLTADGVECAVETNEHIPEEKEEEKEEEEKDTDEPMSAV
ncbi:MAG: hypothetical protein IK115_08320 [Lachnospiraceae bacterium]|nr:hypothetical protein [Lachnospiraceae bacterium]